MWLRNLFFVGVVLAGATTLAAMLFPTAQPTRVPHFQLAEFEGSGLRVSVGLVNDALRQQWSAARLTPVRLGPIGISAPLGCGTSEKPTSKLFAASPLTVESIRLSASMATILSPQSAVADEIHRWGAWRGLTVPIQIFQLIEFDSQFYAAACLRRRFRRIRGIPAHQKQPHDERLIVPA